MDIESALNATVVVVGTLSVVVFVEAAFGISTIPDRIRRRLIRIRNRFVPDKKVESTTDDNARGDSSRAA